MIWLAGFSLFCAGIPGLLFLVNLIVYRRPPAGSGPALKAAVLIPARDEESRIEGAVRAALASGASEVLVLDDGSSDRTAALVREIATAEPRVRLLAGKSLPNGWCGKNFACAQLAAAAQSPILIFVDADVQLAPHAAPRLAEFLVRSGAQLASGIPREITRTFSEKLLIPLVHFLLLGFLPIPRMRRTRHPAYGAGCGQLFVAEAKAYRTTGGHGAIRSSIHDGLSLPKKFREHGFATDLFDATPVAICRMYERNADVWRGLAKNTHEGLGAPRVILPMTLLLLGGQLVPFVLLLLAPSAAARQLALVAAGFALLPRVLAAVRFRQSWLGVILHPFAIAALLGIQWFGLIRFWRGQPAVWKGRAYGPASAPAHLVVRQVDPLSPTVTRLVQRMWDELGGLYPELNAPSASASEKIQERAGFFVAYRADEPVGCGAFQPLAGEESEVAEIRRMYVEPAWRRQGVSRAVLAELETAARSAGYRVARLETGTRQPHAIRLYETSGYRRIEPWGRYQGDPLSVCFEKTL